MPKLPRLTPTEAEKMLLKAGFKLIRSKGSHRIYQKANKRQIIPFHSGKNLHPKIVKQILKIVEE
ncbi:MAG: type II toxin-antitoxin system HicA family toxin [Calditrichia bacterium]